MQSNYLKAFFVLICVLTFQTSTAQNFKNANDYLSFIGKENKKISKSMWKYTKSVAHSKSARRIEGDRKRLIKSIERAMIKIRKAKSFTGEDDYKKQVLDYMDLRTSLLKNDYAKIVDMKEVAEQSYDFMEAYILAQKLADERMQEAQETYENAQKDFAARNNIRLIESETELGRKMKISNEVFEHKNEVYLVFFKSNIQERFMLNALSSNDISAIQQNANALQTFAEEGLQALDTLTIYKEDTSLIEATKKALEFYLDETKNEVPKMLEFFLLNEKFTAIKEAIDKKRPKERTKKEIDQYNAMANDINKAIVDFNKRNETLNKKRTKIINQWNEASAKFLSRHIPKE
ncbi:LIC11966 family surface protein [Kordia sp.]|uniref:LIC11966 family surface protein n=1 Tax=Kordia sp. TaxID=1965332 RepID=UPI003B594FA7